MATLVEIRDFLSRKRIAVVGVSRNPKDFTRSLFREFVGRGYDVVPVNPGVCQLEGRPCYACLSDVDPPVEAALLLTTPAVTDSVVRDCADAGVSRVWMYRGAGAGAVSRQAVCFCESRGMSVVAGECPFMFFPDAGFPHQWHAKIRQWRGNYPR
jgi:uncharacterized protein